MALHQITIGDLQSILRQCAGEAEHALPLEQAADLIFEELGYDCLALLKTYGGIERDYGVELSEDEVVELSTAQEVVDIGNAPLQVKVMSAA